MQQTTPQTPQPDKHFLRSKTIVSSLVILLGALAKLAGVEIGDGETDSLVTGIVGAVASGVAIYGRVKAARGVRL